MSYQDPNTQLVPDRRIKVPHLVFGLLFLGVAGIWALGETGAITGERLTILGPAVLILAGAVGLLASLATGRNRNRRDRETYQQTYEQTFDERPLDETDAEEEQS